MLLVVALLLLDSRNAVLSFSSRSSAVSRSRDCSILTATELNNNDDFADENYSITRRDLLSWGTILTAALSSAHFPLKNKDAYAAVTSEQSTTALPYSSSRQYKSITLSNGLRVLLVNDKSAIRAGVALKVDGAGQFSDPLELPGGAHLMEHMILSSTSSSSRFTKKLDFEDWLSDVEGASNAFTGYERACFHFTSPPTVLMEALTRFAALFNEYQVFHVCRNEEILKREVRRVSAELDFDNEAIQSFYLMKGMMNPVHPYAKFARGNVDSLERRPKETGLDVGLRLFEFFREVYQPTNSYLVVVGPFEFNSLERWVSPFSSSLSRQAPKQTTGPRVFPQPPLKADKRTRQILLYRPRVDNPMKETIETLSMHWVLELDYNIEPSTRFGRTIVSAPQVGFVVSQILGRRGPGSLYYILFRRGWLPPGMQGLPRIAFPVDVSGFQLMKLDINLTLEGFINRAVVVAYVFRAIETVFGGPGMTKFSLSRQILSQYAVVAQLHGFVLAPRFPDAVELAVDGSPSSSSQKDADPNEWSRFPSPSDGPGLFALQKVVKDTLMMMSDPSNAVVITTTTDKALKRAKETRILGETVPVLAPARWPSAPMTGAKYYRDDLYQFTGIVGDLFSASIEEDALIPPLINNLIPPTIRPPRPPQNNFIDMNKGRLENWRILEPSSTTIRFRVPRMYPVSSCCCVFVFQLLSPRPARANSRQAAYAELWKVRSNEPKLQE
jgi:insulysin